MAKTQVLILLGTKCEPGLVEHSQLMGQNNSVTPVACSQVKYQQQQEKLQEQEEIIVHLQKELSRVGKEERQRVATQNKMFCQFCKRAPKSPLDQR